MWGIRRRFWNAIALFKYHHSEPDVIPAPRNGGREVKAVPLASKFSGIEIDRVLVGDHVPNDEAQRGKQLFARLQVLLYRVLSPMQRGAPPVPADAGKALAAAYTDAHRRCFRPPTRPAELEGGPDLAALAVASPYACYLESNGDGGYRWDFSSLDKFECHAGLRSPAAVVEFAVLPAGTGGTGGNANRLEAVRIDSDAGSSRPGDPDWETARRLAMCGATTHLSLIRHFQWVHLSVGAALAMATRNQLRADHPVRRLLWPHVFGTQYSNGMITRDLLSKGGDFEGIFSFTHGGLCDLLNATADDADLGGIHPDVDADRRGLAEGGFATPALDNRSALFAVMVAHTRRYLALYYPSDADLARDEEMMAWLGAVDDQVPNGIAGVAGYGATVEGTAQLLATAVYVASVEHEIVGSGVWDYQLWTDVNPARVQQSGAAEGVDVYQRLVNANFNLNIRRTRLLQDFSGLAVDRPGAEAMQRFQRDLGDLQIELDRQPAACWRMEPKFLKANINA